MDARDSERTGELRLDRDQGPRCELAARRTASPPVGREIPQQRMDRRGCRIEGDQPTPLGHAANTESVRQTDTSRGHCSQTKVKSSRRLLLHLSFLDFVL